MPQNHIMKKTVLLAIVLCFTTTIASAQVIGFIRNSQSRITANLDPIKAEWENLLKNQEKETVLTNFEIQSGADKETGKTYYMLLATNREKTVKVAKGLQLKAGNLSFYKDEAKPWGVVVCFECVECTPEISGGNWNCGSGCKGDGQECKKTETIDFND